jgi:hypothetical protein
LMVEIELVPVTVDDVHEVVGEGVRLLVVVHVT